MIFVVIWEMFHAGFYPSTFLQLVNSTKNSILNWVLTLNLFKYFFVCLSRKTLDRYCVLQHQTIVFTGKIVFISDEQCVLWSQKVYWKCLFQRSGDPNFKKVSLSVLLTQQTVKKFNLWEKLAVEKSAWIKACHGRISLNLVYSAAASEFCEWAQVGIDVYIPHWKYQVKSHSFPWFSASFAAAIVHINHFFVCTQRINLQSQVKFKQASNCCKRVLGAAKPAYANKTKESITFQKLGSRDFWNIVNSVLNIGKSDTTPLFNGPEVHGIIGVHSPPPP